MRCRALQLVAGPHAEPYLRGAAAAKQEQEAKANGGDGGNAFGRKLLVPPSPFSDQLLYTAFIWPLLELGCLDLPRNSPSAAATYTPPSHTAVSGAWLLKTGVPRFHAGVPRLR